MLKGGHFGGHRPLADHLGDRKCIGRRNAEDQGEGVEQIAQERPEGPVQVPAEPAVEISSAPAEDEVEQGQEAEEGQEKGDDPAQELQPVLGAAYDGQDEVLLFLVMGLDIEAQSFGSFRLGHQEFGYDQGSGRGEEGRRNQVAGDGWDLLLQKKDIDGQDGGGDRGHAGGEDGGQLRAGHPGEVRPDDER